MWVCLFQLFASPTTGAFPSHQFNWMGTPENDGLQGSTSQDEQRQYSGFTFQTTAPLPAAAAVHLDRVAGNVTWAHLYPEWIDEEELYHAPACPDLPEPSPAPEGGYDVVAVKLPCSGAAGWSKDVPRLHLQLAAARLAAGRSEEHGRRAAAHVIVVSRCFPAPNLFSCKHEVMRDGGVWLYRPDMGELRQKLALPVGSCRLAMPLRALGTKAIRANTCLCHNKLVLHAMN